MEKLPKYVWIDLRLGEGTRAFDAAKCFYLGRGIEETRHLLDGRGFGELDDIRELAVLNGFNEKEHSFVDPTKPKHSDHP